MKKAFRNLFIITTVLALLLCLAAYAAYHIYIFQQAKNGIWYEERTSKGYLLTQGNYDYIFVGSSRTQLNINTEKLSKSGMNSFNYGLGGRAWNEYPGILRRAVQQSNKATILTIPPHALFSPVQCPKLFSFYDIYFYLFKLQRYDCAPLLTKFNEALLFNRLRTFILTRENSKLETMLNNINKHYAIDLASEGRNINYIRGGKNRYVILFSDGDGRVVSKELNGKSISQSIQNRTQQKFNPEAINYLLALSEIAISHNKKLIINIGPYNVRFITHLNSNILKERLPAQVDLIDTNNGFFTPDLWADERHFNLKGNNQYTELVRQSIQKL